MNINWTLVFDNFVKLSYSLACGFIIGFEREFHRHPGGVCTHMLVSVGATVFTIISINIDYTYADPSRIASQIVSGIGFIGAGTIYKADNYIKGLNTAANIWLSSALGTAIGAEMWELAFTSSLMIFIVLFINNIYRKCRIKRKISKLMTRKPKKDVKKWVEDNIEISEISEEDDDDKNSYCD